MRSAVEEAQLYRPLDSHVGFHGGEVATEWFLCGQR